MHDREGEFLRELANNTPRTGRLIAENGGIINEADFDEKLYRVNNQIATLDGRLFNSSYIGTIAQGASLFLKQNSAIPFRGIALSLVFNGSIDYEQVVGATGGTVLSTLDNTNVDRRILTKSLNTVQILDGFTGGRIVDQSFGINPATGAGRTSSNITGSGIGGVFDDTCEPYFKLTNVGVGSARIAVSLVWKEGDI